MTYKVITNLLTVNKYSRPGRKLSSMKAIVIHYVANKNTSASANRNFFENRKLGKSGYGSAHEFIDLNGDVLVCVPSDEVTYNCGSETYTEKALKRFGNSPNNCTYGIECTHIDDSGKMSDATYNTLVQRCADLCKKFKLNPLEDLWLHKEVVGWKSCHKWFVDNPTEWVKFKNKVNDLVNPPKPITPPTPPQKNKIIMYPQPKKATLIVDNVICKEQPSNSSKTNGKLIKGVHDPLTIYGYFDDGTYTWLLINNSKVRQWIVDRFVKIID